MNSTENPRNIFLKALDQPTGEARNEYLNLFCGNDPVLRARVERLIAASENAGQFLEGPPPGLTLTVCSDCDNDQEFEECVSYSFLTPSLKPGCMGTIGQYEVIGVIGRGAFGIVFRAYDTQLNRIVAIKVMTPELATNPTAVKRFSREAQAAAAVRHDHVVTIHAIDEASKPPFIVMEYVQGESLKERVEREGQLEVVEILRIGNQMAAGLAAAHRQGLVHRDIKPANILLEHGIRRVKITDFGLARAVDDIGMTQTGTIAGTPQFMSPEQALNQPIDGRSDLFSLGSVLYTLCTGCTPFRADSTVATLKQICDDAPRAIRSVNPDIPQWLENVIMRLLEKEPANRFQSAEEVEELFRGCLAHVQSHSGEAIPPLVSTIPTVSPLYRSPDLPKPMARKSLAHRFFIAAVIVQLIAIMSCVAALGSPDLASMIGVFFGFFGGLAIAISAWRAGLNWQCIAFGLSSILFVLFEASIINAFHLRAYDVKWRVFGVLYAVPAIAWGIHLLLRQQSVVAVSSFQRLLPVLQSESTLYGFLSAQILGIALAVGLFSVEPTSIIFIGPLLFVTSIVLSIVVLLKPHLLETRIFAISLPIASLLLAIATIGVSVPVTGVQVFVITYGLVAVPLGIWALLRESKVIADRKLPQFGLKGALVATTALAMAFTLARPSLGFGWVAYLSGVFSAIAAMGVVGFWAYRVTIREQMHAPVKLFALAIAFLIVSSVTMGSVFLYERNVNVGQLMISVRGANTNLNQGAYANVNPPVTQLGGLAVMPNFPLLQTPIQLEFFRPATKKKTTMSIANVETHLYEVRVGELEVRVVGDPNYRAVPSKFKLDRGSAQSITLEKVPQAGS